MENDKALIIPQAMGTGIWAGTPGRDCTESGNVFTSGILFINIMRSSKASLSILILL
jgi:hypothetical protein